MANLFSGAGEDFSLSNPGGGISGIFGQKTSSSPASPAPASPAPAQQQRPTETPQILFAVPSIPVFKYNTAEKKYDSVGKVGVAILGVISLNTFQLIVYQTKENFLCTVSINPQFVFNVLVESNTFYGSFSDASGITWSINFPSLEVLSRFATQVAISKSLSSRSEEQIVTQDVVLGTGKAIANGDVVKIKYVGFLIQGSKAGQIFDSNIDSERPFRLTVGSNKGVAGLDAGVAGMTKKGRRIIVVPSKLGYGATGAASVPANANLVYQVDLVAVKAAPVEKAAPPDIEIEDVPAKESTLDRVRKLGVSAMITDPSSLKQSNPASAADSQPSAAAAAPDPVPQQPQQPQQFNNYQPFGQSGQPGQFQGQQGQFQGQPGQYPQPNQFQQPGQYQQPGQFNPNQYPGQFQGQQGQFQGQPGPGQFQGQPGQFQGQPGQFQGQPGQFQGQPGQFQQYPGQPGYEYRPTFDAVGQQQFPQQLALYTPQQNQVTPYQSQPAAQPGNSFQQIPGQGQAPQGQAPQQPPTQLPNNNELPTAAPGATVNHSQLDNIPFSNAENNKFLHETRMLHEEIKSSIFAATAKIETNHRNIKNAIFGREDEVSKERISGSVLIQTITKYVEDNEQLQREIVTKAERIDELREKITSLLEKNKQLIEEHTNTMEDRNVALSEASEQAKKLLTTLRDEKLKLDEEFHTITETLSQTRGNLTKLNIANVDLTQRCDEMNNEINNLQSELNLRKSNKINEDSKYNQLNLQLRDEQTERKRVQMELQALEEELHEAKENLQKLKNMIEERKTKWIQMKAEIDKQHEDEKAAVMQKMKAQYLKFKKEKDEAVAEAANIERETEGRWRKNILALREQFKEKVDELKKDAEDEKEHQISLLNEQLKQEQKKVFEEQKSKIESSYQDGFKEGRIQKLQSLQQQKSIEITEKTDLFLTHTKKFMESAMKNLMSNVYLSIKEEIQSEVLSGSDILAFLVDSVKVSTFEAFKNIDQHFAKESNKVVEDIIQNKYKGFNIPSPAPPKQQEESREAHDATDDETAEDLEAEEEQQNDKDVEIDSEPSENEEEQAEEAAAEEAAEEDPAEEQEDEQKESDDDNQQESRELDLEPEPEPEDASEPEPEDAAEPEPEDAAEPEPEEEAEPEPEPEPEAVEEEPEPEPEPEPEAVEEPAPEAEDEPEAQEEPETQEEPEAEGKEEGELDLNDDEFDQAIGNTSKVGFGDLLESVLDEEGVDEEINNQLEELNNNSNKVEGELDDEESSDFSSEKEEQKEEEKKEEKKEEEKKEEKQEEKKEVKVNQEDPLGIVGLGGKSTDKAAADIFGGDIFGGKPTKAAAVDIFSKAQAAPSKPVVIAEPSDPLTIDDIFGDAPPKPKTETKPPVAAAPAPTPAPAAVSKPAEASKPASKLVDPLSSADVDDLFGDAPAKPKASSKAAVVDPLGGISKASDVDDLFGDAPTKPKAESKAASKVNVDDLFSEPVGGSKSKGAGDIFGGSGTPKKGADIFAIDTKPKATKIVDEDFDSIFGGGPSKGASKSTPGKSVDIFASSTPTKKPAVNFDDLFS